jgi:transcriptional regulator with PAS, ATPase and Fis domain
MSAPDDNSIPPISGSEAATSSTGSFRWPALFQQCDDALFLLDRRRRILFVNRAWEALSRVSLAEVRGLACRRPRPASPTDSWTDILAHALSPPSDVVAGRPAHVRRLLPSRANPVSWDVEFFPLGRDESLLAVLGRVRPVAVTAPIESSMSLGPTPLPEKLLALRERIARQFDLKLLDGQTATVRRLAAQVRLAASVTSPVLLVGPRGSGKRTLARLIHYTSAGRERALAILDAGRLPPVALAAVLFGDRAVGTVYLHEPARLPLEFQMKLAELLAEPDADRPLPRVLAGCCSDLVEEVRGGRFLDDLFGALSALTLTIPPLSARIEELPHLVARILNRLNEDGEHIVHDLASDAWDVVRAYSWPGNLRELVAVLASARDRTAHDLVAAADLPAALRAATRLGPAPARSAERSLSLEKLLEETERRLIALALRRAGGNKARAAELLGIWRQRLVRRMEALGFAAGKENGE